MQPPLTLSLVSDVFSRAQRLKPHLLERDPAVPALKEIAGHCCSSAYHPARALRCRVAHARDAKGNLPQPGPLGSRSPSVLVNPKPTAVARASRVALRFYYSPLIKRQCVKFSLRCCTRAARDAARVQGGGEEKPTLPDRRPLSRNVSRG